MKNVIIAIVILAVGGAFYGGIKYETVHAASQRSARQGSASNGPDSNGQNAGHGFAGANRGNRNGGGGFVSGNITAKDDKSITVQSQDGSSKIIYFSDSTTIGKSAQGSASDLSAGEQVMVNGQPNADGTVSAQNIQIRPSH